jgi:OOP family OmpA-OmpF porin
MKTICCFFFFLWTTNIFAQNLVVNPSFEDGAECDGTTERIDTVDGWSPIAGRPGFINTNCSLSKESKSFVQGMKLPPASHIDVLTIQRIDIKGEYQQGRLISALTKNKQYVVSMRVRLPIQFCNQPINQVGIVLSEEPLETSLEKRSIDLPSLSLENNSQTAITKQYEWEEISALYVAKGGEKYLAMGNFTDNNKGLFDNRSKKECTYLFIDVVSVVEFKEIQLTNYSPNMALKKNARLLLGDIEFETGSDVLKKASFSILESLAKTLQDNPEMKIEILSYTDNSLDAMESLTFSKAKAKAVVSYLENKDVSSSQLKGIGRGTADAIALNSSAKGRKKNDRIELVFTAL